MANRGRNLNQKIALDICEAIHLMDGPITWNNVLRQVTRVTRLKYTRQTLAGNELIQTAYSKKKEALALSPRSGVKCRHCKTPECLQRAKLLRDRLREREEEIELLYKKFVMWAYNAHLRGVSEEMLNRPLPMSARS